MIALSEKAKCFTFFSSEGTGNKKNKTLDHDKALYPACRACKGALAWFLRGPRYEWCERLFDSFLALKKEDYPGLFFFPEKNCTSPLKKNVLLYHAAS